MNEQLCTRANTVRIIIKKYYFILVIYLLLYKYFVCFGLWSYGIDYRMETLPTYTTKY